MIVLIAGFAAGSIHVLSGPDHLTAIAPLVTRQPKGSWIAGFRWGLGHSAGVAMVGLLSLLLRGLIPVDFISRFSDRLVGLLLIGIGAWALKSALQVHSHRHTHEGEEHEHVHMHAAGKEHRHTHAAFGIGTLHGLAGSSHFVGILPALALPSNALAVTYLIAFGAGTVAAMIVFSHGIGMIAGRLAAGGVARAYRFMMLASSAAAFVVGGIWLSGHSF